MCTERREGSRHSEPDDGDQKTIQIVVEGGVIQGITGIAYGFRVVVRDYDVNGSERNVKTDDDGDQFIESIWRD